MARKELSREAKIHAMEYDNIRYSVVGTKLPREKADQFRTLCKDQGISVSAALSVFVRAALAVGTLDIIRDDIPGTRDDDGTTAAGSCRGDDGRRIIPKIRPPDIERTIFRISKVLAPSVSCYRATRCLRKVPYSIRLFATQ